MQLRLRIWGVDICFTFWFFVVVLLFVLTDHQVLGKYIALPILIHEVGHLFVLLMLRSGIRSIAFTPFCVDIRRRDCAPMSFGREIAVSLGGIAANLLAAACLYLFAFQSMRTMFLIAANLAVALFNLLPIGSLDGGQVVRALCDHFLLPHTARNLSRCVSLIVLTPLFTLSIWMLLSGDRNFTLLLCCLYLAFAVIFRE